MNFFRRSPTMTALRWCLNQCVCVSVMEKHLYHARPYAPKRYTRFIVLCVVFVTAADGRRCCHRHRVVVYFICSSRGFCRHVVFCRCRRCCSRCSFQSVLSVADDDYDAAALACTHTERADLLLFPRNKRNRLLTDDQALGTGCWHISSTAHTLFIAVLSFFFVHLHSHSHIFRIINYISFNFMHQTHISFSIFFSGVFISYNLHMFFFSSSIFSLSNCHVHTHTHNSVGYLFFVASFFNPRFYWKNTYSFRRNIEKCAN